MIGVIACFFLMVFVLRVFAAKYNSEKNKLKRKTRMRIQQSILSDGAY